MWTHSIVAVLLKASQAASRLQRERYMDSQTLLDHWDRVVQDFIDRPGVRRMASLQACMRELIARDEVTGSEE